MQQFGILPKYEEVGRDPDTGAVHVRVSAAGVHLGESFEASNFRGACRLAAKDAVDRYELASACTLAVVVVLFCNGTFADRA